MSALAALQREVQTLVLAADGRVAPVFAGQEAPDFDERLAAYVAGYRTRLIEALATTYSAVKASVGDDEFDAMARGYVEATPSRHYSIRYYGSGFGRYIEASQPGERGRVLGELADWEWLLAEVFDAPDDAPLAMEALAALAPADWAHVSFSLRASLRRVALDTNAVEWWRFANGVRNRPDEFTSLPRTEWVAWRGGEKTLFRSLDATEALALDETRAGASFGALCEALLSQVDAENVALRAASLLRTWLAEEMIAGYSLPPGDDA